MKIQDFHQTFTSTSFWV